MQNIRRLVALVWIVLSVLVPGGAGPAMAMDHAAQPDCPHAAPLISASAASQLGVPAHRMTMASGGHAPAATMAMPSCCVALPGFALFVEAMPERLAAPGAAPRPLSDVMPAQRAIGPDLPPPRG
ncbi:hypothetical protein [Kaistia sp. UC242_56]|uniref:hypothetical protein n=1 Tax=Kaistia sp. UC242_56 TaxID=3374625 RepID=UPI00378B20E7